MEKYPAHSTEYKHPYVQSTYNENETKTKRKGYGGTCLFAWVSILLVGITLLLVAISPERTRAENTLDNTLLPELDIFPSETPTQTPTDTPTVTVTPEPTIDWQATQFWFDATKTQIAIKTQQGEDQEIHLAEVNKIEAQADEARNQSQVYANTLTFAAPMATDQAKGTQTQQALDYAATTTPRAIEYEYQVKLNNQKNDGITFLRWLAQVVIAFGFALFGRLIWRRFEKHQDQVEEIENYQDEQEAKAKAFKLADQAKQLLSLVEISIDEHGGDSRKLAGARELDKYGIGETERKSLINLLKINNQIFEKQGGHGVKGFYLKHGTLDKFFEEIASGNFPPPGSFGRAGE